ncbi:MAG: hypothetical protein PHI90_03370 [Clostridia bacterium]|nr:hypothetical protein [Clostridia bacterium]MDD4047856.1 hypothetical protein [Clostridia bacterium]
MAETIECPFNPDLCNCSCNCQAYLAGGRLLTVGSLVIDGSQYTYTYTITNEDPAVSFIIFCIQCPVSSFTASASNTTVEILGNPDTAPAVFLECTPPGCESSATNRFSVEFDFVRESKCCPFQGIKININPADTIDVMRITLIFTLPDDVVFSFKPGPLQIKAGQNEDIVNNLCLPGCLDTCDLQQIICEIWQIENKIITSKKDVFIHFAQLLLPPGLDLSTLTADELESRIRTVTCMEKSIGCLDCNIAKVLAALNNLLICNSC